VRLNPTRVTANVKLATFQNDKDVDLTVRPGDWIRATTLLRQIRELAAREHADLVHLLHLEPFLVPLALAGRPCDGARWSGLLYFSAAHYPASFGVKLPLRRFLSAQSRHLLVKRLLARKDVAFVQTDDPYYLDYLNSEKARLIPEHSTQPAGEARPKDLSDEWERRPFRVLCFGALSRRHGIFQLCDALERITVPAGEVGVLFAGRGAEIDQAPFRVRVRALQAQRPDVHISHIQRFLDDEEIQWAVSRASLIAIPYQQMDGSSSVMCWAARAGVPVLSQDWGLVGKLVTQHRLGETVDSTWPEAIAQKLSDLARGRITGFDAVSAKMFAESNSAEAFGTAYIDQLAAAVSQS